MINHHVPWISNIFHVSNPGESSWGFPSAVFTGGDQGWRTSALVAGPWFFIEDRHRSISFGIHRPIAKDSHYDNSSPKFGYGSIPINTIFSGMNIHLPAILMFTRVTRFWHTAIWRKGRFAIMSLILLVLGCRNGKVLLQDKRRKGINDQWKIGQYLGTGGMNTP